MGPMGGHSSQKLLPLERDRTLLPKAQRLIYLHQSHLFIIVEEMSRRGHFGEWELMVLLVLMRLGEDAYGVPICRQIEAQTGREVPVGSVYATLERLEEKGFVSSELGNQPRSVVAGQRSTFGSPLTVSEKSVERSGR